MISGIKFVVNGLNQIRFINDFAKKNIKLFNITREKDILTFIARCKDEAKIVDYLKEKCYNILSCERVGFAKLFYSIKKNVLVAAAAALSVILLAVSSRFCFTIVLDTTKNQQTVMQALSDYGVKVGCNLSKIDFDDLENHLTNNIDGISYALVDINGSTLSVKLIDSIPKKDLTDYEKHNDIVATRAGTVTRIVCLAGTPAVAVGDEVSVGQVLIRGLKTFRDGTTEEVRAVGEVYASVSLSHSLEFNPVVVEYVRTGKKQILTSFDVYGHNADALNKIKFKRYETETKFYTFFPIAIVAEVSYVYELKPKLTHYTYAEMLPLLKRQAEQLARDEADFPILEVITAESGNIITVTVTGEIMISQ